MWYEKKTLLYENSLSSPADVKGFKLEGQAEITFPEGRLRLRNTMPEAEGQRAIIVYWCGEEFPSDVEINWEFYPLSGKGLCIFFFSAKGCNGEDIFAPGLSKRTGEYHMYHSGDINAFHVSYYRRMYETERCLHVANLRKSRGFHLVAQGADPIPYPEEAKPPYRIRVVRCGNVVEFYIEDIFIFRFEDDGKTWGKLLGGGKIGFRQMSPMVGEYENLKVYAVEKTNK